MKNERREVDPTCREQEREQWRYSYIVKVTVSVLILKRIADALICCKLRLTDKIRSLLKQVKKASQLIYGER